MRFEVTTLASPDQVLRALTDFSDRRLETWRRTLDPRTYEVRELGDTWAVARESTAGSPFWVVSRYDWSDPTAVRATVVEASWGGAGDGTFRIHPAAGGGSRVQAEWSHTGVRRLRDTVLIGLIHRFPMRSFISRMWVRALDDLARSERVRS
ncbi:MAG TPA: SRPBCC family protein [Pedococcus sp.]